ncbi:MAG: sterol desaturase family protein [Candidatus Neomarinimicrobiota bacterium]|jgi:methylsterol monooxygenase|nr:sterol desaturase family protein [Candidatus Neomarinimicrobiota bacterium]|tara:strand:+ start:2450 stop:3142 length:693 start_codon:yes stop_codon:yes gene_type:complete
MDITTAILITVAILFCTNLIGYIYTALILHTNLINDYRIQPKEYFAKRFYERFPLILFNISILLSVGIVGVFLLQDFIDFGLPTVWVFTWQLVLIFLIDDLYFYFYHSALHTKFLYKHIHKTHHRSTMPIPMEYIFTHPLEWFFGAIGPFIGLVVIASFSEINIYAFWVMSALRNLHELDIHSGIKSSKITSLIPFYGTTEHHDLHHSKNKGNYASTFTLWDKVFGTEID